MSMLIAYEAEDSIYSLDYYENLVCIANLPFPHICSRFEARVHSNDDCC